MESSKKNTPPPMDSSPSQPQIESSQEKIPPPPVESSSNISRTGKGRKRTDMSKIQNKSNREVTFSKRRNGIFKKSSEISTLCNAEVAIIVFSPSNMVYSFGSPSVETVTNRFDQQTTHGITGENQIPEEQRNPDVSQRNQELTMLGTTLDEEKQRQKEFNKLKKKQQGELDKLSFEELSDLREFILNFRRSFDHPGAGGLGGGLPATSPNNQGQPDNNVDDPGVGGLRGGFPATAPNNQGQPDYNVDDPLNMEDID